jgi:hypothetical protein
MAFVPSSLHSVEQYSFSLLKDLLSSHSDASPDIISAKLQLNLLEAHFKEVKVATVVVEDNYVDYDYLDAVSAFYVECFHEYARYGRRLHFFSDKFDKPAFSEFLESNPQDKEVRANFKKRLIENYVGFIVVRPLPEAILGRVCIKPYGSDRGRRHFPVKFTNKVNLFGLDLTLVALPFQEQDNVTAQCATSALWSAFHATAEVFYSGVLPPVEITRMATARMSRGRRTFPSADGLTSDQIGCAISGAGLAPYFVTESELELLKSHIYAHVVAGIPAILGLELIGKKDKSEESIGYHAVTVTGYNLSQEPPENSSNLISGRINKLYVHDDQVGPYARMEFKEATNDKMWHLSTSLTHKGYDSVYAKPYMFIFPLHNKIRLPFKVPYDIVGNFELGLEYLLEKYESDRLPDMFEKREWAIRLTTVNNLRREILESEPASKPVHFSLLKDLLTLPLPRFLWHAYAKIGDNPLIDIFFDATDIDSGSFVLYIKEHNTLLSNAIAERRKEQFTDRLAIQIRDWLNQVYDRETKDYQDLLNKKRTILPPHDTLGR